MLWPMDRVAVVDREKCRPKDCGLPCIKQCPMVKCDIEAIRLEGGYPVISELLCTGCGICVRRCPFGAISIVRLPTAVEGEAVFRYGPNTFKLYRLPVPLRGYVTGLVGVNGIGKTTVLKLLSGRLKVNLGRPEDPPSLEEVLRKFRGSPLQEYLRALYEGELKVAYKPQYVDRIPEVAKGVVGELLERVDERGVLKQVVEELELQGVMDRPLNVLSGGELQRVAIAAVLCRDADVYLLDEPSSHLDVYQRMKAAKAIRRVASGDRMVVVAEHDLAMLDYLSDQVYILYGKPDVYGIVSRAHGVREGINIYVRGYIPDENVRFRSKPITFHERPPMRPEAGIEPALKWTDLEKGYETFHLRVEAGEAFLGEVVGIVGKNGVGKTTFMKLLAGVEEPDSGEVVNPYGLEGLSYKPQYPSGLYTGTVREVLEEAGGDKVRKKWFISEVIEPLHLTDLMDRDVEELSGGALQRLAIAACLLKDAKIYLLDEPSAYLDVEERLSVAKAIKRMVETRHATAFVVEHDVVSLDFMADRLMVFLGEAGRRGEASKPMDMRDGMNMFLKDVGVTFRRDPETRRPRVNKEGSRLDRLQKETGEYYYVRG